MAQYPGVIPTLREVDNDDGVIYDANAKKVVFAEDINNTNAEIMAIAAELGIKPKSTFANVSARIQNAYSWAVQADGKATLAQQRATLIGKTIRMVKTSAQSIPAATLVTLGYNSADAGYDTSVFQFGTFAGGIGVKILSDKVKTVNVGINSQFSNGNAENYLYLMKNQNVQLTSFLNKQAAPNVGGVPVPVSQGDIIQVACATSVSNTITGVKSWNNTTIQVAEVAI